MVAPVTESWSAWLPRTLLNKDDSGNEFVTFVEGPTKTRQGGLRVQSRSVLSKMFATGESRCPVALLYVCMLDIYKKKREL